MRELPDRFGVLRRLLRFAAAFVAIATMTGALFAPHLPRLAAEGFPRATWPAPGRYAVVRGIGDQHLLPSGAAPSAAARERFETSGGRALLVDRHGSLVVEAYGEGMQRDDLLNSYSLIKSLVGALVLRAVADGRIAGLDQTLRDVLGPKAPAATVGEALMMTSGLVLSGEPLKAEPGKPLDDGGFSPFSPVARLHAFGVKAMLPDLETDNALKGQFRYQSANTALLGLVLERAYGRPLPALLSELIWAPAGAEDAHWRRYPAGDGVSAYCCLYARPIDWLRVGRFLLENGTPDDPLLPEPLWRAFLMPALEAEARRQGAYGLHIRHDVLDREGEAMRGPFAYLMGHGGQMVYLMPEHDMVVVRFGERPQLLHSTLYELTRVN